MACNIDATPKGASANSYGTIGESNTFHETHIDGDAWADLDETTKCRALQQATREIDAYLSFDGWATTTTQKLAFPRIGLTDPQTEATVDQDTIPDRVKFATFEQARLIATVRNRAVEASTTQDGINSIKAGPIEIEFAETKAGESVVGEVVAPSAFQYLACWARVRQAGRGGAIPLVRM